MQKGVAQRKSKAGSLRAKTHMRGARACLNIHSVKENGHLVCDVVDSNCSNTLGKAGISSRVVKWPGELQEAEA